MKNPGIDLEIWETMRKKWADLHTNGHKVSVEFKLVSDPNDKKNVLMIDVVQKIDDDIVVETVQKRAGEAYPTLGIDGASMELLVQSYKKLVHSLWGQYEQWDGTLTITMMPTSPTSGELHAVLENQSTETKLSVPTNYQYYYLLTALREKMIEQLGENWSKVTTVCRNENVDYHFEYSAS